MDKSVLKHFSKIFSPVATSDHTMSQSKPVSSNSRPTIAGSPGLQMTSSPSHQPASPSSIIAGLVIASPGTSPSLSPTVASPRQVIGGRSPSLSPPQAIPNSRPVPENSPHQASQVLVSLNSSGLASYHHLSHKHGQSPHGSLTALASKGQQCGSLATLSSNDSEGVFEMSVENVEEKVVEEEKKNRDQGPRSGQSSKDTRQKGTEVLKVSPTTMAVISEALGKNEEDLRTYKSSESTTSLRKDKFLRTTKRGHSWHCLIPIDANGKKRGVIVRLFLIPAVTDKATRIKKAVLQINATVKPSLLVRLRECGEDSWVIVESEIRDQQAGKKHGESDFTPYAIDSDDGRISFCQDLVTCEKVRGCVSECVNLAVKVTFLTSQRNDYTLHENEDGFCEVHRKV